MGCRCDVVTNYEKRVFLDMMNLNRKAVVSWSGGKDCCLACYKAIQYGYDIACLLNTTSKEYKRVRFHGVREMLIQAQARAIGFPLLQKETSPEAYEQEFKEAIKSLIPDGVGYAVFGDIFPHMRAFADRVCDELGIKAIEPLIGLDSEDILLDFIDAGFEAVVVTTQADILGEEWLGRKLDREFLKDIKALKNVDVCGEHGEYHTLVINGPIFKQRIHIEQSQNVLRAGYWFADIEAYHLADKK